MRRLITRHKLKEDGQHAIKRKSAAIDNQSSKDLKENDQKQKNDVE